MNEAQARKAIKNGVIAAVISGTLGLLFFLIALYLNKSGDSYLAYINDPWVILDVIVIFVSAYFLNKNSRTAAIILIIHLALTKLVMIIEFGQRGGLLISLIWFYFYIKALHGTFVYHKLKKQENPDYRAAPKYVYYIGIPLTVILIFLMGIGVATTTSLLPSTSVQSEKKVLSADKHTLIENNIIKETDQIKYFYSYGIDSILEGGSVLVDDRVIVYEQEEDKKIEVYELYFDEIDTIELVKDGDWLNDSLYKVVGNDPEMWLYLILSKEGDGDAIFIETLKEKVKQSKR